MVSSRDHPVGVAVVWDGQVVTDVVGLEDVLTDEVVEGGVHDVDWEGIGGRLEGVLPQSKVLEVPDLKLLEGCWTVGVGLPEVLVLR